MVRRGSKIRLPRIYPAIFHKIDGGLEGKTVFQEMANDRGALSEMTPYGMIISVRSLVDHFRIGENEDDVIGRSKVAKQNFSSFI